MNFRKPEATPMPVSGVPKRPIAPAPSRPENTDPALTCWNQNPAETLALIAQANEAAARQLHSLQEITRWLGREVDDKARRLAALEEDLHRRETILQAREDEVARRSPHGDAQLQEAAEMKRQAEVLLTQVQTEREQAELAKTEAARRSQAAEHVQGEVAKLHAQLWPEALRAEVWQPWRAEVFRRATADAATASLLACMHLVSARERSGEIELALLRELGRQLCQTFPAEVEAVAEALTQTAQGRFELRAVRVGDRVDQNFMKPLATSLAAVTQVMSWAVRDANQLWQFPAEVN